MSVDRRDAKIHKASNSHVNSKLIEPRVCFSGEEKKTEKRGFGMKNIVSVFKRSVHFYLQQIYKPINAHSYTSIYLFFSNGTCI